MQVIHNRTLVLLSIVLGFGLGYTIYRYWFAPEAPYHLPEAVQRSIADKLEALPPEAESRPSPPTRQDDHATPPGPPSLDDGWSALPRNGKTLAAFFGLARANKLDTDTLFRNDYLNPRDVYIPRYVRCQLGGILGPTLKKIEYLHKVGQDTQHAEATSAVKDGQVTPHDMTLTDAQKKTVRKRLRTAINAAQRRYAGLKKKERETNDAEELASLRKQMEWITKYVKTREDLLKDPDYPRAGLPHKPGFVSVYTDKGGHYVKKTRLRGDPARRTLNEYYFRLFVGTLSSWFGGSAKTLTDEEAANLVTRTTGPRQVAP